MPSNHQLRPLHRLAALTLIACALLSGCEKGSRSIGTGQVSMDVDVALSEPAGSEPLGGTSLATFRIGLTDQSHGTPDSSIPPARIKLTSADSLVITHNGIDYPTERVRDDEGESRYEATIPTLQPAGFDIELRRNGQKSALAAQVVWSHALTLDPELDGQSFGAADLIRAEGFLDGSVNHQPIKLEQYQLAASLNGCHDSQGLQVLGPQAVTTVGQPGAIGIDDADPDDTGEDAEELRGDSLLIEVAAAQLLDIARLKPGPGAVDFSTCSFDLALQHNAEAHSEPVKPHAPGDLDADSHQAVQALLGAAQPVDVEPAIERLVTVTPDPELAAQTISVTQQTRPVRITVHRDDDRIARERDTGT